jgi:beta-lactamase superfamily II metal-dependent hydrolase
METMQTPAVPSVSSEPGAVRAAPAAGRLRTAEAGDRARLRVRMYRVGMGDCFLLTFRPGEEGEAHVLVDAGSIGRGRGAAMEEVVADIEEETGGHLAAVVATHEHADHLSGFPLLRAKGVSADEVWLAWTENPEDPLAIRIAKYRGDLLGTAARAGAALEGRDGVLGDVADGVREVLGWNGLREGEAISAGLRDGLATRVQEMMTAARALSANPPVYCNPGTVLERDWAPGVRFYVLGPPRDAAALQQLGDHGSPDLYELALAAGVEPPGGDPAPEGPEAWAPFDSQLMVPLPEAARLGEVARAYDAEPWRKIDDASLGAAADLALQLDGATNNTSLVLAVEVGDELVLLPGDAQLGSWRSWPDQRFGVQEGGVRGTITGDELLGRVTLLKVGHHASHNGTARPGLERMGQRGLTALIPLDEAVARAKKWPMPARMLEDRLEELTHGRVIRSDGDPDAAQLQGVKATDLYFEVRIGQVAVAEEARAAGRVH